MLESNIAIAGGLLVDIFADFFDNKINNVHSQTNIDPDVYNGIRKINSEANSFWTVTQ
jgi:hypothetical protein